LIGPSFGVLYCCCWLSKDRLVKAMLRHAHFYIKGGERSFAASANHPSRGVGSQHSGHPKLGLALRCRKSASSPSSRIEPAGRMPALANTRCRAVQFTSGKFSQSCKGKQYQKTQYHSNFRNFLHFFKALQARHHETWLRLCYKSLIKTTQK